MSAEKAQKGATMVESSSRITRSRRGSATPVHTEPSEITKLEGEWASIVSVPKPTAEIVEKEVKGLGRPVREASKGVKTLLNQIALSTLAEQTDDEDNGNTAADGDEFEAGDDEGSGGSGNNDKVVKVVKVVQKYCPSQLKRLPSVGRAPTK